MFVLIDDSGDLLGVYTHWEEAVKAAYLAVYEDDRHEVEIISVALNKLCDEVSMGTISLVGDDIICDFTNATPIPVGDQLSEFALAILGGDPQAIDAAQDVLARGGN